MCVVHPSSCRRINFVLHHFLHWHQMGGFFRRTHYCCCLARSSRL
jgi:hypothetical protein